MPNDIVERLRSTQNPGLAVRQQAADEIESLRSRLADWHKVADDRSAEIVRLNARLAESEAENARLVAANKARDEFLRGHRYKHSEVDGYINLCESQIATLKARLAEAVELLASARGKIDTLTIQGKGRQRDIDAFLAREKP